MLFPGSREQEIRNHIDIFIKASCLLKDNIKELQIIICLAPKLKIRKTLPSYIKIINKMSQKCLVASDAAIIASGTATIEAVICNTPMVITYNMNYFSWFLSKMLIKVVLVHDFLT